MMNDIELGYFRKLPMKTRRWLRRRIRKRKRKLVDTKTLEWIIRYRERVCPNHGGVIQHSLVKGTFWCPECEQVWKVIRNTWTWKVKWYYLNGKNKSGESHPSIQEG